jgi:hypothetical protein
MSTVTEKNANLLNDNTQIPTRTRFSIRTRTTSSGKLRTEAIVNRGGDNLLRAAISHNPETNRTSLFIDHPEHAIQLTGKEAKALYKMLNTHYSSLSQNGNVEKEQD